MIPIVDKDASNDGNKGLGAGALAGIIVGAVAAAVIIIKKKQLPIMTGEADMVETNSSSITVDNNLQSMIDKDDPFAEEFDK